MQGYTNFSRRLYRLSGTGIVECLEIIDVACNLNSLMVDLTDPDHRTSRQIYATAYCIRNISVITVIYHHTFMQNPLGRGCKPPAQVDTL